MKLLERKVAIITGASRRIGKGITEVFAKHVANVTFTYSVNFIKYIFFVNFLYIC